MSRIKTFDSTGLATAGRLYAGDLNQIQDQYADLSNFSQAIALGSLAVGEAGLQLVRYGVGEARISGALRIDGILRALGGLYAGAFTTAQRDAIPANLAPTGLIIYNTTLGALQVNSGTDASRNWTSPGSVAAGSITVAMLAFDPATQAELDNVYNTLNTDARMTNTRTPTDGSVTDAKVAAGAAIQQSKLAALVISDTNVAPNALSPNRIAGTAVITTDPRLSDQRPLSYQKAALAADISMDAAGTTYDAVTLTLPAGTWKVDGYIAVFSGTATSVVARLWDGTTVYKTGSTEVGINTSLDTIPVSDILVLGGSTIVRLAATTDHSAVASIKAKDMGGVGTITYMHAVKIA